MRDKFNVMTISLHEGLPGHHLQTSVAQERKDLPSFRRFDSTNAYVEGWGLYAETLGRDMGFYEDPWSYYEAPRLPHSAWSEYCAGVTFQPRTATAAHGFA